MKKMRNMKNLEWLKSKGYSLIDVKCEKCKKPVEKIVPSYKAKTMKEEGGFTCETCRIKGKRFDKIMEKITIAIMILAGIVLIGAFFMLGKLIIYESPINRQIYKQLNSTEDFCKLQHINENRVLVFVDFDCQRFHFPRCDREYMIYADKHDGKWLLNQSTKVVLW